MNTPFQLKKLSTKNDVKAMVLLRIAYMQVGQNVLIVRIFFKLYEFFAWKFNFFWTHFSKFCMKILQKNFVKTKRI